MFVIDFKNTLQKRNRRVKYKNETKDLGSHLKKIRLEMKRNQDWVAKGICSVSYLSKIENNNIEFNQNIVREIMERLELDPSIYQINMHDEQYLKRTILYMYQFNEKKFNTIYEEVKEVEHNLTINLVKLAYMVKQDNKNTEKQILMMEHLIASMSDLDLQAYLVFSGIYYEKQKQYPLAFEMLELSLDMNQESEYLQALACAKLFEINQRLHKRNSSFKYFLEAKRLFQNHNNIKRLMKLKLMKAKYLIKEQPMEAKNIIVYLKEDQFDKSDLDEYYLISAKIYQQLGKIELARECVEKISLEHTFAFDKLLLQYQLEENETKKDFYSTKIEQLNHKEIGLHNVIQYRLMREPDRMKRKTYLKDVAIPYAKKSYNFDLFKEFVKEITEICMSTSRYKEATQHIQSYIREKEKIHQYIENFYVN